MPLYQYTSSDGFWQLARQRLGVVGCKLEAELRGIEQMALELQRWQHLVPEPMHERLILELKASPEWPQIQTRFEIWKDL